MASTAVSASSVASSSSFPPSSGVKSGPAASASSVTSSSSFPPSSGGKSSVSSKSKRKQSALGELDGQGSLKRRGARSVSASSPVSPGDAAILANFHGSMNHFSDVIHGNNSNNPHAIIKDATSKLNGTWGQEDCLTYGQKIVLLKLFRSVDYMASMYASMEDGRLRRGWVLSELIPHQTEIAQLDAGDLSL